MEKELDRLTVDGTEYFTEVPEASIRPFTGLPDRNLITAFIPGQIVEIRIAPGDAVVPGSVLLLLEAMKMHNELCSETSGRVREVHVKIGDTVQKDQLLVEISN